MYAPCRPSRSQFLPIRGLRYHVRVWGDDAAPKLVLLHGWMDVSASFQFLVDALAREWHVLAPDWRGYGHTQRAGADCYWFADYLGDLDALLEALSPSQPVDLVAHSMGGNVAALYAGVRPARVRRLVNLEGFGMAPTSAEQAPQRYARWLDELRAGGKLRDYADHAEVAARLMKTNPRLSEARARWLAQHWSQPGPAGRLELAADPAHRIVNPYLYRVDEVLAVWRRIEADVLWVQSDHLSPFAQFVQTPEYEARLACIARLTRATVRDAGHMLHHDQPEAVARLIESFVQ